MKVKPQPKIQKYSQYRSVLTDVVKLLESARYASSRAINSVMTTTYWEIGRRIVEFEQRDGSRQDYYGKELVDRLARELTRKFGRGFGRRNLFQMRAFYLAYRKDIVQTVSAQSSSSFLLPWSHYVRLLSVESNAARKFYEQEAIKGGWSVRQLERQIGTLFYERTMSSKKKVKVITKGSNVRKADLQILENQIKDPFVLEFLNLKDEYSESDLEEALIRHLESFLLELGNDFAFVGRQRKLRVGDTWYRIDLLFYHRRLKCLLIIDLKLGFFNHADVGQMNLYLNYAQEHWVHQGESPPVGLILCAGKDSAVAKYALGGLSNKVLAAEYKTILPSEKKLIREIQHTKKNLENRTRHRSRQS